MTVLIYSLFWLTKRNTYIFYIREISIIFLSAMKIDFDVITLRGCLMCFWQYKMDRNRGWCWIEDTVVSWTLSQTENAKIKTHAIKILSRRMSLRKNGDCIILMLKIAKDAKSSHYILFIVISEICSTGGRSPKLIRWTHPLTLSKRAVPEYRWIHVHWLHWAHGWFHTSSLSEIRILPHISIFQVKCHFFKRNAYW